jgi:hypothetical protein
MLALNTNRAEQPYDPPAGRGAPFLLVADLTARSPARPEPTVSSDVGAWAPAPTDYHGSLGFNGTVTLAGPGGGTVTVTHAGAPGPGAFLGGRWTETYDGYSDDGRSFVSGTVTATGLTAGTYSAHLTMTGEHTGSQDAELVFNRLSVSGHAASTLDGQTISGPPADMVDGGACPSLLPRKPALKVAAARVGPGTYRVTVTASVAGMGPTESAVDVRPVAHATLRGGVRSVTTDARGVATVTVRGARRRITASAGNTLQAASITVRRG